ncbi:MAG TPA: hypothetical protein VH332_04400 [Nitrospira sp.]
MDTPLASVTGLATNSNLSVLIIEAHPTWLKVPQEWRNTMPDITFDVCTSDEVGRSKLSQGRYHAMISDTRLIEANHYSLLKMALDVYCPVPVLISAQADDLARASQALYEGALAVIPCASTGREASSVIRSALWVYRLQLTLCERRRRLQALVERRAGQSASVSSRAASALLERTIRDIQETNARFDRTIQQIEASLHVLEDSSHRAESQIRECAMRMVRLLSPPENGTK